MALGKGRFALSLQSIFRFAGMLREVELHQPELFVSRFENGDINLLRLISESDSADEETDPDDNLPRFGIAHLKIIDGLIEFSDKTLTDTFRYGYHSINFELNDFTTFREEGNQLNFNADNFYGGILRGRGAFSPQDLTASIDIELAGLELPAFAPYVSEVVDLNLQQGQLSLKMNAVLDAKDPADFVRGTVTGFEIQDLRVLTY